MSETGVLLINLGTPTAPEAGPVRVYLREFLSDPRVLDMNPIGRALLLNLFILPFRPAKSARAYREIWDPQRGSPLMFHSVALTEAVSRELGQGFRVRLAMRYGQPSIAEGLRALQAEGVDRIVVLPLYPQYASSSTGSSMEEVYAQAARLPVVPELIPLRDFYDAPEFLDPAAALARPLLASSQADHVLFSFHGVPERQVTATNLGPAPCRFDDACCAAINTSNRACYRAQSFATARALAERLGLQKDQWSVSFQSRLGRIPWIRPYTDEVVPALAQRGVKRLLVLCPSFTADCLETLEEMGIRGRDDFMKAGGEGYTLVPCVNSDPAWVSGVAGLVRGVVGG